MPFETGPNPDAGALRERLLEQWEPRQSSYLTYREEIKSMLATHEQRLRLERRMTTVLWIYVVVLTTIMLTGSGLLGFHRIEGTFMAVTAVFWFLFGAIFLFIHMINKSCFEVIKEIKGVELRLAALEERLGGKVTGPANDTA